ncbi:MAG TPA: hypothetical protein VEK38_03265 [Candidatus Bathyarchaeia archaeon]|nr:hypothetical protein [Candidatus Bathyarchaeia archaeon]
MHVISTTRFFIFVVFFTPIFLRSSQQKQTLPLATLKILSVQCTFFGKLDHTFQKNARKVFPDEKFENTTLVIPVTIWIKNKLYPPKKPAHADYITWIPYTWIDNLPKHQNNKVSTIQDTQYTLFLHVDENTIRMQDFIRSYAQTIVLREKNKVYTFGFDLNPIEYSEQTIFIPKEGLWISHQK